MTRSALAFALALCLAAPAPASAGHDHEFDFGLFSWKQRGAERKIQVLDLPLVSLLDVRRRDPDFARVQVLDVPFFTLFERRTRGAQMSETRFVDLPLVGSLYRHKLDANERKVTVLFLFRFTGPGRPVPEPASDEAAADSP